MKRLTEYTIPETGFSVVSEEKYKRIMMEEKPSLEKVYNRLKKIEDILGEEYDLDRLRELAEADRMIGKEVWAQAKYLNVFQTKSSLIQRTTIQYVSLLKGKDILCHTQTCAFPLNEIGKTVFLTRAEAEAALRREQDG